MAPGCGFLSCKYSCQDRASARVQGLAEMFILLGWDAFPEGWARASTGHGVLQHPHPPGDGRKSSPVPSYRLWGTV